MTDEPFTADLDALALHTERGIVSKTVYESPALNVVLFTFDAGQELSEHTASVPAIIHLLEGEAEVQVGEQHVDGRPGFWAYLPARLPHAIRAKTRLAMLLTMLRGPEDRSSRTG
jgi:quercetin dioxygenase-like cupin family protein